MAPAPVEPVIFDCDGVLIDSERLAIKLEVKLLGELGWPLSEAEVAHDRDERVRHRYRAAYAAGLLEPCCAA